MEIPLFYGNSMSRKSVTFMERVEGRNIAARVATFPLHIARRTSRELHSYRQTG
jgi:hypothetical protein